MKLSFRGQEPKIAEMLPFCIYYLMISIFSYSYANTFGMTAATTCVHKSVHYFFKYRFKQRESIQFQRFNSIPRNSTLKVAYILYIYCEHEDRGQNWKLPTAINQPLKFNILRNILIMPPLLEMAHVTLFQKCATYFAVSSKKGGLRIKLSLQKRA